jgi:serine/threonine protein kinase
MAMPTTVLHNRYQIIKPLGQGGMGAVYLAEDLNLPGRLVAVKENFDSSQRAQEQFKREAVILARMKHPSLPQVTDHFLAPNRQYLVMEYVEGEDLDEILSRRGALPEHEVLSWMGQIFEALEYMHGWVDPATKQPMPIIHRDIKPGNIKRTPEGRLMLVDFGIAKYQTTGGTETGARAASPGFSPVEQYSGGTDPRSDIYALGATLYCLLTAEVPPESPAIAGGVLLPTPRSRNPHISPHVEQVILKAMQLQAGQRYQSIRELRQALSGGMVGQVQITPGLCPTCGMANKATAKFCGRCGTPLAVGGAAAAYQGSPGTGPAGAQIYPNTNPVGQARPVPNQPPQPLIPPQQGGPVATNPQPRTTATNPPYSGSNVPSSPVQSGWGPAPQPIPQAAMLQPFSYGAVILGSLLGAACGTLLAYMPRLALPGAAGPAIDAAIFAGVLLFGGLGGVTGAFMARRVSLAAPDYLSRLIVTIFLTLLLATALGLGVGLLGLKTGIGPIPALLAFVGNSLGSLVGTRLTETKFFRQIS